MITVWKYPIPIEDKFHVEMPVGAQIIYVDSQLDHKCGYFWAIVDTEEVRERRSFVLFGTGTPIETGQKTYHRGSFQLFMGSLVYHLFELL